MNRNDDMEKLLADNFTAPAKESAKPFESGTPVMIFKSQTRAVHWGLSSAFEQQYKRSLAAEARPKDLWQRKASQSSVSQRAGSG